MWAKFGFDGEDGISSAGQWKVENIPYEKNQMVSFGNGLFSSKKETSLPPVPIYQTTEGRYALLSEGAYALMGSWDECGNKEDWDVLIEPGALNGKSFSWQGSYASDPYNPQEGWAYYNTVYKCSYIFQNGAWNVLSKDGQNGNDGKDGKDYEWIYKRTATLEEKPSIPVSENKDDYIPDTWTDDAQGVSEDFPYEWSCKRIKTEGLWGEFSSVSLWAKFGHDGADGKDGANGKDGKDGADGASITPIGAWSESILPIKKGSVVTFGGSSYVAKADTSNPPIAIWSLSSGKYARTGSGAYALMGTFESHGNTNDWQLVAESAKPAPNYWIDIPISAINIGFTNLEVIPAT